MTCWTSLVTVCRMKLFFQCSLLDMPGMSLSHHNTLYLKQPLLKATRFIPLRQLELPIGLWNVVVYCVYCGNLDTAAVHVAASCEWCGCLFCLSLMFLQRFDWLRLDLEWSRPQHVRSVRLGVRNARLKNSRSRTRVLSECLCFFQWYKVNLFPGPGHWNLFPPK